MKANDEAAALVKVLVGNIKLHKHDKRREVQDIIEEVGTSFLLVIIFQPIKIP